MLSNEFKNVSLSNGTMRTQDLIPCFMSFLKAHSNDDYKGIIKNNNLNEDIFWPNDDHEWWNSENCHYLLNEDIWEVLNNIAPENCGFGSHYGDGSDYGFWEFELDELM